MFWFNFIMGLCLKKALAEQTFLHFVSYFFSLWSLQRIKSEAYPSPFLRKLLGVGFVQLQIFGSSVLLFFFFSLEMQGIDLCWNSIAIKWKCLTTLSFHMVKRPFPPFLVAVFGLEEQNCFLLCWLRGFSWMSCSTLLTQKEEEIFSNPPVVISDGQ